jgi:hypothetical protein
VFQFVRAWPELCDYVLLITAKVIKNINSILQKKIRIFYVRKKNFEKNPALVKVLDFFT